MTGEELKAIRRTLGLTQQQLATALGYTHGLRISEFERASHPVAIPKHVALLMDAINQGYRPPNWPQQVKEPA